MSVPDRVVDAWVWFTEDPEQSIRDLEQGARALYEISYWAGPPLFLGGAVAILLKPQQWRAGLSMIGLGFAMLLYTFLPVAVVLAVIFYLL